MSVIIDGSASVTINSGAVLGITSGTAVSNPTSPVSSSIDFTSIPSWVKRITVMFQGVSTNLTSNYLVQIGAGSVATSGYLGTSTYMSSAVSSVLFTTGFGINKDGSSGALLLSGNLTLTYLGSNIWIASGIYGTSDSARTITTGGNISLGGTLDRVRITTVNGTDTFDAGTVNIMYEG